MAQRPYPSFLIYIDDRGEYRWKLQAKNFKSIANSGEGYQNLGDCEHAIGLVQSSSNYDIWENDDVTAQRR